MNVEIEEPVRKYLAELRASLGQMKLSERDEILREIQAHIRDCAEEPGIAVGDVLTRLGPPRELAAEYRDGLLIRAASRSFSPFLLLRATLRIATKGIAGAAIFFVAVMGYSLGGGLILTALLKPLLPPGLTGLWIGPHVFGFGIGASAADHPGVHEVLGIWYVPVALALGGVFLYVTMLIIRMLLRVFENTRRGSNARWNGNAGVSASM